MKLFISPNYTGIDPGNHGGIRRIIDAQKAYFATSLVDSVEEADTVAIHAGSLVKLRSDQKVITHCHGLYWSKYDNWGVDHRAINQSVIAAMKTADFITAPTEWVANSIRRGMYRQVDVVPHAVDEDWAPGDVNKGYVLWNKSRVDRVCDPTAVYQAAAKLDDIEFRLTVGRQTSKNITITGLTPYADKIPVQQAGCYLATAQETFGIGILEALACGVPVVGWNWGGQAEILPKEWLAPEGDINLLCKLIRWALDHRDDEATRVKCIKIAAKYTWEAACKQYEEIYTRSLGYTKRVSIVIRNYNTANLLPDAIESVIPQLTDEDECIVVDDCSTDNSKEVVSKYDNVKWLQTPQNLHCAGAQNFGVRAALGKYIIPLDSDNMLGSNAIKVLVDALEADRNIDIAYGRIEWLGLTEAAPNQWPPQQFSLDQQLKHRNQIPCTAMYRRKVYDVAGPYRNRCRVAEDADFWCRATALGFVPKMITTANTLKYRIRKGTTSQTEKDWPWESWYNLPYSFSNSGNNASSFEPILLSVILPVGSGHELLLEDALDSLYMQSFKNWECIVVNDTGKVLPWMPPWVKVFNTPGNVGPSIARNIGLGQARGKLFVPLDADDYLAPIALQQFVEVYTGKHYVYSDYFVGNETHKTVDCAKDLIKEQMPHILTGLYPIVDGVLFNDMIAEDWDFALQMSARGICGIRVPKPLVYYRKESGTRRKEWSSIHRQKILDKWSHIEMACSPCQQRAKQLQMMQQDTVPGEWVLVQYIGDAQKRYYVGSSSGKTYAFGTPTTLREKYVLPEDLNDFRSKPDLFSIPSDVASNVPALA